VGDAEGDVVYKKKNESGRSRISRIRRIRRISPFGHLDDNNDKPVRPT
jgi:hypothetical protein